MKHWGVNFIHISELQKQTRKRVLYVWLTNAHLAVQNKVKNAHLAVQKRVNKCSPCSASEG